ncbi:MAG: uroporphyrinogen-III C-methyltransferase [Sedimentisphaerales bacterium]|nr:uroporphyrinogen-III C-methyltransferase [Sedimentisphaerales bacterium]
MMKKGFVYLVGAGPGRADLITVRGAEVLKTADCVIYDKLANPALLHYARRDAEIVHVPKRIGKGSCTQDEINHVLVEKALGGKTVVRLKGGDPCMFGRVAEELAVLIEAGVGFEIVPGVTAAVAASSYTGILMTDREYSSQVTFITGREAAGKDQSNIDWSVLAKFAGTIVFYMGIGTLESIAQRLIENGKPADTPVAIIANATLPAQRVLRSILERVSDECKERKIEPPALVVIGEAANSDARFDWFMKKPLFGKHIVMTRDAIGNAAFAEKIVTRGGNPISFPTIRIESLTNSNEFLQALTKFHRYDWIVFTSGNGVAIFFEALKDLGKDARVFGSAKVAAIGSKTAAKLASFGVTADFVPDVFTGRELGRQLIRSTNVHGKKILLLRSQIASNELVDVLVGGGADVDNVALYTATASKDDPSYLVEAIRKGTIDYVTFASPSSVDEFFERISADLVKASKVKVTSIGPVTSERLEQFGIVVHVTASEHTLDGLLDAIEEYGVI